MQLVACDNCCPGLKVQGDGLHGHQQVVLSTFADLICASDDVADDRDVIAAVEHLCLPLQHDRSGRSR